MLCGIDCTHKYDLRINPKSLSKSACSTRVAVSYVIRLKLFNFKRVKFNNHVTNNQKQT